MVVDADALFALAERKAALAKPGGPRILTPHPGEFARITGSLPEGPQRITAAAELARRDADGKTIVVLKGHNTVVTDGTRFSINQTGNPGMATGGSGDVLTGIITALLCQGLAAVRCRATRRACSRPGRRPGRGRTRTSLDDRQRFDSLFAESVSSGRRLNRKRRIAVRFLTPRSLLPAPRSPCTSFANSNRFRRDARGGAVAIGNFDGVHRGHVAIVKRLLERAEAVGGPAIVFTFDPHPVRLLRPDQCPPPLTWTERKAELLAAQGVDWIVAYPTDEALLQLSAADFFQQIVRDALGRPGAGRRPQLLLRPQSRRHGRAARRACRRRPASRSMSCRRWRSMARSSPARVCES